MTWRIAPVGLVAVMLSGAGAGPTLAQYVDPAAQRQLDGLISQNLRTRGLKLLQLDAETPGVEAPGPPPRMLESAAWPTARVWIHASSPDQLAQTDTLVAALGEEVVVGGRPRAVEVMPVQEVDFGPAAPEVRFFKPGDEETAIAIAAELAETFPETRLNDMTGAYGSADWIESGHIEVWLGPPG